MNLIDILLILILILSVWSGYKKGFLSGFFELIGWLSTLYLALIFYPYLMSFVEKHITQNSILTFLIAFLFSLFIIRIIVYAILFKVMQILPARAYKQTPDRILGIIPGIINGLLYALLLVVFLGIYPFSSYVEDKLEESKLAPKIIALAKDAEEKIAPGFVKDLQLKAGNFSIESGPKDFIELGFTVSNPVVMPELEEQMLELINKERKKEGIKALTADPELQQVARNHSRDMFNRGYFSHYTPEKKSPFTRINEAKVNFTTAGENLAIAPDIQAAHEGLMNSPGHKANILRAAFGRVGIGILKGGRHGIMVTQNFRN